MIRFDDVICAAVEVMKQRFGADIPTTTLVRDALGSLTVILPDNALSDGEWGLLSEKINEALGRFSPGPKRVLLRQRDLIDPHDILESPDRIVLFDELPIWLIDRLLTNQDWLRRPTSGPPPIPTATVFSIKGGVGRSTALAVLAWHLARIGRKVLVIDLDLEAPGIGAMLLAELPEFGTVDWCVESLAGQADAELLDQMLASVPLADNTDGSIMLIPAFGRRTRDYVAKVGRAYMPIIDNSGSVVKGLSDRLRSLIEHASQRMEPPDVVLLDSRAGLHDIGSAAVTQLGAEVFLFARDDAQSWDAYRQLFGHLRFSPTVQWGMPDDDLRWRLRMVAAQIEPTASAIDRWIGFSYSAWTNFYDGDKEEEEAAGGSSSNSLANTFDRDDQAAPHYPLSISYDSRVRSINLIDPAQLPDWAFVETAFKSFIEGATARLFPGDKIEQPVELT